jgi:hypothetical protein
MGEVYRARDARLQRAVAVKVLPELFATDPERRARFERESQVVAALSHPNILAIFDVGVQGNIAYAVTELLEGETLRERLVSGPLALRRAVDYGVQIARGLAAAHDKGIVHRDLKPENVFLLPDGQLKLLDFGLARTMVDPTSVTITTSTVPGTVMGTVGYMAPEQIRGQSVDQRADLFALGAVLYEMLSGRRAFQRDTAAETMAAILNNDPPDLGDSEGHRSPGLERIVRHCLERSPAARFQSARDVAFAIEALSGSSSEAALPPGAAVRGRWTWSLAAGLALLLGGGMFVAGRRTVQPGSTGPVTYDTKTFDQTFIPTARFLPDGRSIVFSSAARGAIPELFVSRPNTAAPQRVGSAPAHLLSVSPSGELAVLLDPQFLQHRLYIGTLARMTLDAAPRPLLENVREADWAPDGASLAIVRSAGNADRLEFPAGRVLYETGGGYLSDPRVSPDGRRVAFFDHPARWDDRGWLKVVDTSGAVTTLTAEYSGLEGLAWSRSGASILFSATVAGFGRYQPRVVTASGAIRDRPLLPSTDSLFVQDVARDGRVVVIRMLQRFGLRARGAGTDPERDVSWLNASIQPHLSTDEKLVLFTNESETAGANYSVGYRTIDGGAVATLGDGTAMGFSPDGKWVLAWLPGDPQRLILYPMGPGAAVELDRGGLTSYSVSGWFPDSQRVFVCGRRSSAPPQCHQQRISGGAPEAVTPPGYWYLSVAPDGRTMSAVAADFSWHHGSIGGGDLRPIPGIEKTEDVVGWTADSRAVFVQSAPSNIARIDRLELGSGSRTPVRQIGLSEAGVTGVFVTDYRADGAYAYWYRHQPSTVFLVSGLDVR